MSKQSNGHDDYDDDFEAYDEDFEQEEEEIVQQPSSSKSVAATIKNDAQTNVDDKQATRDNYYRNVSGTNHDGVNRNTAPKAAIADEKGSAKEIHTNESSKIDDYNTTNNSNNSSRNGDDAHAYAKQSISSSVSRGPRVKKFSSSNTSSVSQSLSGLDPRGRRISRLHDSNVLDMQEDKFTQINIIPISKYDVYARSLRVQNPALKQVGVPNDESSREMGTGTDVIETSDKGIQFSYGDDTALLNIMNVIKDRKQFKGKSNTQSILEEANVSNSSSSTNSSENSNSHLIKLYTFLEQSSQLVEAILEEERVSLLDKSHASKDDKTSIKSVFATDSDWQQLGRAAGNGANEMIRSRKVSSIKFSLLQPYMLMSTHPSPTGNEDPDDLRLNKGLYCIWNMIASASPSFLLESSGEPTCCCFSDTQANIVVAGTAVGSIHLWDLQESSSMHKDRDAIDLCIDKGIRKPSYSVNLLLNANKDIDSDQHTSAIIQIESIGGNAAAGITTASAVTSQFASLDRNGTIILWITSIVSPSSAAGNSDHGLSPTSTVSLVQTRVLHIIHEQSPSFTNYIDIVKAATVFATIPHDVSTLLAASSGGCIKKLARFGEPSAPTYYNRSTEDMVIESANASSVSTEIVYSSTVTCIAVRKQHSSSSMSPLLLAGRDDGSVDLFQIDKSSPLQSWALANYDNNNKETPAIVVVRWCPTRSEAFFAIDAIGRCYFFDILLNASAPMYKDSIPKSNLTSCTIDISNCKPGSKTVYASYVDTASKQASIKYIKLADGLFHSTTTATANSANSADNNDDTKLHASMNSWASKTSMPKVVGVLSNVDSK